VACLALYSVLNYTQLSPMLRAILVSFVSITVAGNAMQGQVIAALTAMGVRCGPIVDVGTNRLCRAQCSFDSQCIEVGDQITLLNVCFYPV